MEDDENSILLKNCLPQQRGAITLCYLELIHNFDFVFSGTEEVESNNFKVILGSLLNANCAILPIYHEYQIGHDVVLEFVDKYRDRKNYLGLVGADGSIVLYQVGEIDISSLEEEKAEN